MMKKINLGLIFGGKSPEHEVSLQSTQNVLEALDRNKYDVFLIGIDKQGQWHWYEEGSHFQHPKDPEKISLGKKKERVNPLALKDVVDVVFPILHGPFGEDGTVQGLLKLADVPFVGADVLGSSIGMDKDVMKRLLQQGGLEVANFIVVKEREVNLEKIGFPCFVKPANLGSSLGIHKVKNHEELEKALEDAFLFDRKVLIEEAICGREVECSLLGNEDPIASFPCEIIPKGDFQSYLSKYLDEEAAICHIPAKLEPDEIALVQEKALEAYRLLCCEGLARVDMFLTTDGKVIINELNTLPGLTNLSPYAKMWESSGISYKELIDRLVELACERHEKQRRLITQIKVKENGYKHSQSASGPRAR